MVAHQRSTSPKRRFNASSIGAGPAKAKSRPSEKRKIVAKFCPAFLKVKRSARQLGSLFATKTRGRGITPRQKKNFGRRTPISLTRRNTEFETGRAEDARRREKRSGGSRP